MPDRQSGVLNDLRRWPSSLRREANDGRQRELARGLENIQVANVAKSQYFDAWYQSLTHSLFVLAKEFERTRSLSWLSTVAPDRRLREQHGRLGVCFFVSGERKLPSLPWMWASRRLISEARLLLSQVVDRVGRIEAPPPFAAAFMYMYRLTGGSISGLLRKRATANPFTRASCYSWSSKGHTGTTGLAKNRERTTLPSTTSDRQRARVKSENVC